MSYIVTKKTLIVKKFFYIIKIGDDMMDCLFCKIIKGDIPSYTLFEDEIVKVILDINPTTNGDALIIPKKHIVNIDDIDDETYMHIFRIVKKVYPIIKEKLKCDGLTLIQNNGYGQEIKHYHLHTTPRYTNDMIEHNFNKESLLPIEEVYKQITN